MDDDDVDKLQPGLIRQKPLTLDTTKVQIEFPMELPLSLQVPFTDIKAEIVDITDSSKMLIHIPREEKKKPQTPQQQPVGGDSGGQENQPVPGQEEEERIITQEPFLSLDQALECLWNDRRTDQRRFHRYCRMFDCKDAGWQVFSITLEKIDRTIKSNVPCL